MLLNVNLTRQLLLVLRLLGLLSHVVRFRGRLRIRGSAGRVLGTCRRCCVRGVRRLHGEVGGVGRVGQSGAVTGSRRKGNDCREGREKVLVQMSQLCTDRCMNVAHSYPLAALVHLCSPRFLQVKYSFTTHEDGGSRQACRSALCFSVLTVLRRLLTLHRRCSHWGRQFSIH